MATSPTDSLVILLHGVGSRGSDIGGLAEAWRAALPDTAFAAPDAPEPSSFGAGYQWFSVAGITEQNRASRIVEARRGFDLTVGRAIEQNGFTSRLDRVAFVGFSQGTIMSLDAIVSGRWLVAGVLGYSGRLASPEPLAPALNTEVLLVHGDADRVIPVDETMKAASTLKGLGLAVDSHILPGVDHTITAEGAALGAAFLTELFRR